MADFAALPISSGPTAKGSRSFARRPNPRAGLILICRETTTARGPWLGPDGERTRQDTIQSAHHLRIDPCPLAELGAPAGHGARHQQGPQRHPLVRTHQQHPARAPAPRRRPGRLMIVRNSDCPGSLPGGVVAYHAIRREFIRICGSWAMAWMTFQPCFLAVEMKERMTAKSVAPAMQRKPPEIFCLTFIMRASRSA